MILTLAFLVQFSYICYIQLLHGIKNGFQLIKKFRFTQFCMKTQRYQDHACKKNLVISYNTEGENNYTGVNFLVGRLKGSESLCQYSYVIVSVYFNNNNMKGLLNFQSNSPHISNSELHNSWWSTHNVSLSFLCSHTDK